MMKIKARRLGAALVGASMMVAFTGCSSEGSAAVDPQEVQMGATQGAYSVANSGSGVLSLVNTYGDYAF